MGKSLTTHTKLSLLILSLVLLVTTTACSRDLKVISETGKHPSKLSEPTTEYVEGVVLDRRFSIPGYGGKHFNVIIGYGDLTIEVGDDAELYSDYKIGDKVPIKFYKYEEEDIYEIKYIRDRQRLLEQANDNK